VQNAAIQPSGAGPLSPQKGSGEAVDTNRLYNLPPKKLGETFNTAWYVKNVEANSLVINQGSEPVMK
jgi:hypothetical protein